MSLWVTQLRRGLVELAVLAVLKDGEAYGYEIVERLNTDANLEVGESTVYPILARLHGENLLAQRRVASPNGPPRRYFKLTKRGLLHFERMIREWESLNACVYRLTRKGK